MKTGRQDLESFRLICASRHRYSHSVVESSLAVVLAKNPLESLNTEDLD